MMKFSLKVDLSGIKQLKRQTDAQVRKAAARALNKTIEKTATVAAREVSAATKIPVRDVKRRLQVRRAHSSRLVAAVEAFGYSPNLSKFRATQNKKGVSASAWERRKVYRHAFILPSGKVVTRTTSKRFPLKPLRGPSVRSTFVQQRIISKLDAVARQAWRTNMEHELARELRGSL